MGILRPSSLEKLRLGTGGALVVTSTLLLSPLGTATRAADKPAELRVAGHKLGMPRDTRATAASIAREYLDAELTVALHDRTFVTTRRALGVSVDDTTLATWLAAAKDPSSDFRRARTTPGGSIELPMPFALDEAPLRALLLASKADVDRAPEDARIDLETGALIAERAGASLDVFGTVDAFRAFLDHGGARFDARFTETPATRKKEALAGASIAATLGEFETRYNLANVAADRTHNLEVSARQIDGYVILPGEVFDFNAVVGERTALAGYREATVISGGELADGLGGGTCQISGTLHAAVFFAGLPILERQPHSRPSSYIKLGLDAMVAWPRLNFRFRNDLPHPIVLRMTVGEGVVRAKLLGPERTRKVSFVRRIDRVTPYDERRNDDPTLPAGVRVLVQRGVPGFGVSRARTVRDPARGAVSNDRSYDVYPPTTQIWRVGTGPRAPRGYVPPQGDTHPEYRADEVAEMVQGPGTQGTRERLESGRTGAPGWTVRAGMPRAD